MLRASTRYNSKELTIKSQKKIYPIKKRNRN